MNKILYTLMLILSGSGAYAQSFQWQADLPPVAADGFFNIIIDPEIISNVRHDLSDIRLYGNGEEIPYILRQGKPIDKKHLFKEYKIVENKASQNCCTRLILENINRSSINNISLIIRNADVRKKARLSGSDDLQNWYSIKEQYYLEGIFSNQQTYEARVLDFPLSNYSFYRLEIDDSTSAPLQILKAGYYDTYAERGKYVVLHQPDIVKIDSSDRNTYIWFRYKWPQVVDKISFTIDHPAFYHREATITRVRYDKRNRQHLVPIHHFDLRSNQENEVMTDFQSDEFCMVINNKDNPPLRINNFKVFQLVRYLTAYLHAGEKYHIKYGNIDIQKPEYDLIFYNDSIPAQAPTIKLVGFAEIPADVSVEEKSLFTSTLWIWIGIVIIIGLLGYMSWRMVSEMNNKNI